MSIDEDSFIVIEETPSLLQYSILDSISNHPIEQDTKLHSTNVIGDETNTTLFASALSNSNQNVDATPSIDNCAEKFSIKTEEMMQSDLTNVSTNTQKSSEFNGHNTPMSKKTLAHSFLLGDINCDIMKSCYGNLNTNNENIEKWRSLVQERNDLKDALQRTNATMRQQYSMVNDWHNCVKDLKNSHDTELKKFRTINDELFQQNYDLQAKVAELQHLAELSRKTRLQTDQEQINLLQSKNEQLENQMQNLKLELANAIATKVDTDEAYHESKKQCDRQNVELLAIRELYKNASTEIATLKAQNDGLRRELEHTKTTMEEQKNVIQAQCDVYRKDFEIERKQREEMADERDQMVADITMLKRRNQALVDEAQSYYSEASATSLTSTVFNDSSEDTNELTKYVCPLCAELFGILNDLESHVQSCLEKNG